MQLSKLINNLDKKYQKHTIKNISFNSKNCKPGSIFFSIKGNKLNGEEFINEAIQNGANTIISNDKFQGYKKKTLYLHSNNPRSLLAKISSKFYPGKSKNLIAVTGTNGKSSIANFYNQIMNLCKKRSCSIGTLGVIGKEMKHITNNTTVDPISLHKILNRIKKKKIENVILEASSHGLHQSRLDGVKFDIGIFTNLTKDHLDYHGNYKNYLNSKLILFKNLIKKDGLVIYDTDIKESKIIKKIIKKNKLRSLSIGSKGNLRILKHSYLKDIQKIEFIFNKRKFIFFSRLIGYVQIKNLLMAVLAASCTLPIDEIIKILSKIKNLNGRFEKVSNLKNYSQVILDYSHTPDALKNCISNIKSQYNMSKISIVFGCGGERDKSKRKEMGRIANNLCNNIYLTDDNPRGENPKSIRSQIKTYIKKKKLIEIPSREKAIETGISNLKSGDILIVAGKGHETFQEYKKKKFFSDKVIIKKYIKNKNLTLSNSWKINILNESLRSNKINNYKHINTASTNSKKIKKNQIFFGLKGKKIDGSFFAIDAIDNKAVVAIVNKTNVKNPKIISVNNSLKFFSEVSKKIRQVSNINAIAVTGSAGKTSFKNLLNHCLSQISSTTCSKNSFNNKFGVPISLFNINMKNNFGVFEVGMDKKNEINTLSNLIRPDVGIITNISYAHIKNFKSIKGIADAKSELIDQIKNNGYIILNKDDRFFDYFKKKALKKRLNIISFSKNSKANIKLKKIYKYKSNSIIEIIINQYKKKTFMIPKILIPYIDNILGSLGILSIYFDIEKISKNIFTKHQITEGRGNISNIKINKKNITLINESYNSNPLSLKFSIDKMGLLGDKKSRRIALLGDMLELGKFSKKLHIKCANYINNSKINKVFVTGKYIRHTFNKIKTQKKGRIVNINQLKNFVEKDLKNKDYLMVKGSNSTGLNRYVKDISGN